MTEVVSRLKKVHLIRVIKNLYKRFIEDDIPALGAQLTYNLLLSFFPFLIVTLAILSYVPITRETALNDLSKLLPADVYVLVQQVLREVRIPGREAFISFGTAGTILAASSGAGALMKGINKAYNQKETRPFWSTRMVSIIFTLGLALVILLTGILLVFGERLIKHLLNYTGFPYLSASIWNLLRFLIPLLSMLTVFIWMYHHIPNKKLSIKEVIPGAVFSTLGTILASLAFSYYINHFATYSRTYGSIGGIIVLLLWLYWSSIVLLLGGELNALLLLQRTTKEEKIFMCKPRIP